MHMRFVFAAAGDWSVLSAPEFEDASPCLIRYVHYDVTRLTRPRVCLPSPRVMLTNQSKTARLRSAAAATPTLWP